ncbi:MAG: suppressor of fused domain protein [Longicatena sp.]
MGLLDKFKKKQSEVVEEQKEESHVGWDAIEKAFLKTYPEQINPKHYATLIKWRLGGKDPLDGISIYESKEYWHFVTFGLSELYEKESENLEYSGYGMEFTFKLKKDTYSDEEGEIRCICGILQSIARVTFQNRELFQPYEYLYTGQTQGIDSEMKSNITGFISVPDQEVEGIDTPFGRVDFIQFIGVTNEEITAVKNKEITVKELFERLGSDITNYHRKSIL